MKRLENFERAAVVSCLVLAGASGTAGKIYEWQANDSRIDSYDRIVLFDNSNTFNYLGIIFVLAAAGVVVTAKPREEIKGYLRS